MKQVFTVALPADAANELRALAADELREPKAQAAVLILEGLRARRAARRDEREPEPVPA